MGFNIDMEEFDLQEVDENVTISMIRLENKKVNRGATDLRMAKTFKKEL
jgi:hypothetical protein